MTEKNESISVKEKESVAKKRIVSMVARIRIKDIILLILLGIAIGLFVGYKIYTYELNKMTKLERVLVNNKVYEVKEINIVPAKQQN